MFEVALSDLDLVLVDAYTRGGMCVVCSRIVAVIHELLEKGVAVLNLGRAFVPGYIKSYRNSVSLVLRGDSVMVIGL